MESPSSALLPGPGDVVAGKYCLERLLGKGGMGAVFAARHIELGSPYAIKVMLADPANDEARTRFLNEGRAAARIESDHVMKVHDVGSTGTYSYMVLELLDGEDLAQILERRIRLTPREAVEYVIQALQGVHEAHAMGIVHRDLKPSNLFLARKKSGASVIKILDFGISKAQGAQGALGQAPGQLTSTKAMLGSPLYMSPEQLRSSKSVDARADIWAMGVILYELLTGTLPFMGESLGELFAAILETDPSPVRQRAPECPPELEAVVLKCLQRRPEHRFQTAPELSQALAPFAQAGVPVPMGTQLMAPNAARDALAGARQSSQQAATYPNSFAQTPSGVRHGPMPGTTTGSGAHVPVVKGTVALGATTPQPSQTLEPWSPPTQGPKAGALIAIGVVSAVLVIGAVAFGVITHKKPPVEATTAPSLSSPSLPIAPPPSVDPPNPPLAKQESEPAAKAAEHPSVKPMETAAPATHATRTQHTAKSVEPPPAKPAAPTATSKTTPTSTTTPAGVTTSNSRW